MAVGTGTGRGRWAGLVVISVGVALIIMDATVVNIAVPLVIRALRLNSTQAMWLNAIYSLAFAGLLLGFGRIGDLIGRRKMITGGLLLLTAASVAAGLASSGGALIAARGVQGVGAAMIMPASLSTINALFTGRERGIAFAAWGATIGGMAAVGPVVGGALATYLSWRWAFWLNIPVGLATMVAGLFLLPETRDEQARRGFDVAGAALSALGFGGIVFGLIESQRYGWWLQPSGELSPVPVALAAGALLLALLAVGQVRRARAGRTVLVDVSLLAIRSYRIGAAAAAVVSFGEFGLLFTLPLLLQGALGYSALGTGLLMLALASGAFGISGATAPLTARIGARAVVQAGLAAEAVAIAGLSFSLSVSVPGGVIAIWLFLYGTGVGMATAQLTSVLLAGVPAGAGGEASGLLSTVRQLGAAFGVAVLGGLLVMVLAHSADAQLAADGINGAARAQLVAVIKSSIGLAGPAAHASAGSLAAATAGIVALVRASRVAGFAAAGILAAGLLLTFRLPATEPVDDTVPDDTGPDESSTRGAGAAHRRPDGGRASRSATPGAAGSR